MARFTGIVAVTLLLAACGESETSEQKTQPETTTSQTEASKSDAAKTGVYGDLVYGDPNAPIEIVEYASTTCPACAAFASRIFPTIKKEYIDTGKAKLVYRNFVMNQVDLAASTVARCVDDVTAKKLMSVFFARQNDWLRAESPLDGLAKIARRAGISRTKFDRCVGDKDMHRHLAQMTQTARKEDNVNSTPTIFVNGERVERNSLEEIKKALDSQ